MKLMTKFLNKLKKNYFWPIFDTFFIKNPTLSRIKPIFLTENNYLVLRKRLDRWTEGRAGGRTNGKTLYYGILLATAGGPIKPIHRLCKINSS